MRCRSRRRKTRRARRRAMSGSTRRSARAGGRRAGPLLQDHMSMSVCVSVEGASDATSRAAASSSKIHAGSRRRKFRAPRPKPGHAGIFVGREQKQGADCRSASSKRSSIWSHPPSVGRDNTLPRAGAEDGPGKLARGGRQTRTYEARHQAFWKRMHRQASGQRTCWLVRGCMYSWRGAELEGTAHPAGQGGAWRAWGQEVRARNQVRLSAARLEAEERGPEGVNSLGGTPSLPPPRLLAPFTPLFACERQ